MQNSENFDLNKNREIEKLQKLNEILSELTQINSQIDLLNNAQVSHINKILETNTQYVHKLESNEFEIAIVGLEKAGKSTFVNALIENNVLPSAPERCTFTTTRLVHGNDKATVEFYTEQEFDKIFKEFLKDILFPNYQNVSYKAITLEHFQTFFDWLENNKPDIYKTHLGKTDEEIKDIIKCRDDLILTGETKNFSDKELLSDAFQAYIKGEDRGQNTAKPRSVKRIEIQSKKLAKLQTAIIYDVPGFDSPTKIHEKQTIERLNSADAIILITNVGRNPSLVGTQLNIITKHTDQDGIPLKDKLFIFGNQLDTANSQSESLRNFKTLKNDVEKYKLAELKRVFCGSALKYLVFDKKIIENEDYTINFDFDSGIEQIMN